MSNYHDTFLSFSTIILSACLSYITARITSQSEYKKSVLDTVYKKVVYPIYITIYADIKRYKSDSSFEPTLKQIQTIKNKIMNILKNSEGAYTDKFYSRCKDLSPTNYKSFCEYIERNYHECVYKLDYYLPYGYFGKEKTRARIIFLISTSLLVVSYFLITSGTSLSKKFSAFLMISIIVETIIVISTSRSL